ncbi:hypothetical protein BD410DRAFT_49513 [Rickenella mellea]|uniref:Uncharacterized protein n=1 Tax=Rickenella mellea TaxID=50990 RepID=A0A4V3AZQ3_9AGAM|nr:hypothetical protein BD410DRAFT_49513 [Rickenella mellea]
MALCSPDLTLEPFDPLDRDFDVDKIGATHVCRDWSAVYTEMSRNWDNWETFWNQEAIFPNPNDFVNLGRWSISE